MAKCLLIFVGGLTLDGELLFISETHPHFCIASLLGLTNLTNNENTSRRSHRLARNPFVLFAVERTAASHCY